MKKTVRVEKEIEIRFLKVKCGVRYWEDGKVNGVEDTGGDLIPLREGDYWCPLIELDTGIIQDWPKGTIADVHYKCCDDGDYWLIEDNGTEHKRPGYYVPSVLDITGEGYGDYVILTIDGNGQIADWPKGHDINEFFQDED